MLTKDDLKAIGKLVEDIHSKNISVLETRLNERIIDLENKFDDLKSDMTVGNLRIRAELKEETRHIRRELTKIRNDQELIIKFTNEELIELKKRSDKIEQQVNLNPTS